MTNEAFLRNLAKFGFKSRGKSSYLLLNAVLLSGFFTTPAFSFGLDIKVPRLGLGRESAPRTTEIEEQAKTLIESNKPENIAQALQFIELAQQKQIDSARLHFLQGLAYTKLGISGRDDKAILAFVEALVLTQGRAEDAAVAAESRAELATIYMRQGNYDEAGGQLKRILETRPLDCKTRGNLGICYLQLGFGEAALNEFKQVLAQEPDNFIALYNSGLAYTLTAQTEKAASAFEKAIASGQKNKEALLPMAYLGLARVYCQNGRFDFALKLTERAESLSPKSSYVFLTRSEIYEARKETGKAIECVRKALEANPGDKSAQSALARILNRQKELSQKELIGQTQTLKVQ